MRKQNENHLYNYEIRMIHVIKNMIIYIEQSVTRKTAQHMNQKNKKSTILKHQKNITKEKKQNEQFET